MRCDFNLILWRSRKLKFTEIHFNLFSLGMTAESQTRRGMGVWFVEFQN